MARSPISTLKFIWTTAEALVLVGFSLIFVSTTFKLKTSRLRLQLVLRNGPTGQAQAESSSPRLHYYSLQQQRYQGNQEAAYASQPQHGNPHSNKPHQTAITRAATASHALTCHQYHSYTQIKRSPASAAAK